MAKATTAIQLSITNNQNLPLKTNFFLASLEVADVKINLQATALKNYRDQTKVFSTFLNLRAMLFSHNKPASSSSHNKHVYMIRSTAFFVFKSSLDHPLRAASPAFLEWILLFCYGAELVWWNTSSFFGIFMTAKSGERILCKLMQAKTLHIFFNASPICQPRPLSRWVAFVSAKKSMRSFSELSILDRDGNLIQQRAMMPFHLFWFAV